MYLFVLFCCVFQATAPTNRGDQLNDLMSRITDCVTENWKNMRRTFRRIDKAATGIVTPVDFRRVLKEYQINLSENEFFHILTHYARDLSGRINYNDFIRAFISA